MHPRDGSLLDTSLPDCSFHPLSLLPRSLHGFLGFLQLPVQTQGPSCSRSHEPFWLHFPRCPINHLASGPVDSSLHQTQPQALPHSRTGSGDLMMFPLQVLVPLPTSPPPVKVKFKCYLFHKVFHDAQT